jgi:lytic murein transglycosylase
MLLQHEGLLAQVETQYGVPKEILVAFWGLETQYGENKGNFGLPSALMTLAYEGRRAEFFRSQLLDAIRIVDAKHNTVAGMRGSWAGAMGHMQFMPSTLLKYGVDADGDGRFNVWTSLPDAFASAANYLAKTGWRKDEPVAIEVKLPTNFDYSLAQINSRKSVADWVRLGVFNIDDSALPALENAAIVLPQGWQGPAFMVFSNFDVIMDWNRSVNYALSVAHLANQFIGDKPIMAGLEAESEALTFNQMWALQGKLNELGFDCGAPDGFPGLKTQVAIRQYQAAKNLPQDGYASPSLYQQLLQP